MRELPQTQEYLVDRQFGIAGHSVWYTSDREKIGVVVTLKTERAVTEHVPLIALDYSEINYPEKSYKSARYSADIRGLNELLVFVDLRSHDVVRLLPFSYEGMDVVETPELRELKQLQRSRSRDD